MTFIKRMDDIINAAPEMCNFNVFNRSHFAKRVHMPIRQVIAGTGMRHRKTLPAFTALDGVSVLRFTSS